MKKVLLLLTSLLVFNIFAGIPLPEHPRPDFERSDWVNLNGSWEFQFDEKEIGLTENWQNKDQFTKIINVPFPWGSALSGITNNADIAWYKKDITVPKEWEGKRVFLIIGACDWGTMAWINGEKLGEHQGGYLPFEFELTKYVKPGETGSFVIRVDDKTVPSRLYGKQGYGDAKGIWQTVYLEARPDVYLSNVYFTPDIDKNLVHVKAELNGPAPKGTTLDLAFVNNKSDSFSAKFKQKNSSLEFDLKIDNPVLWSLDNPHLYDVVLSVKSGDAVDNVSTYFGMRKISVEKLPGTNIPYVALNGKPVYLQTTLDQAYHPDGFYTYPSDEFMRDEILRSRQIGLNGNRIHIKVEIPRKLYWADKLGVLIMADVPNAWTHQPDPAMRVEAETTMREMLARDHNHPSIFSWVIFNETWGLFSQDENNKRVYTKDTQEWVTEMYHKAKKLDPSRLVEDNSPCNLDHVITDLNTWHAYLPGYDWQRHMDKVVKNTYVGSGWNYVDGKVQDYEPNMNSECGNVWGYHGSTGDVDYSWDYHLMMNAFRRHPEMCGWLYTEHHDVINEWNGYYKYDRSPKFTGFEELVPGMTLNDMHSYYYLALDTVLCKEAQVGETVTVPVFASFMGDDAFGEKLAIEANLYGVTKLGVEKNVSSQNVKIDYVPWMNKELEPITVTMPDEAGLYVFSTTVKTCSGTVLHNNFMSFIVNGEQPEKALTFAPNSFVDAKWSQKQWNIFDGLKVNGAGAGYFKYSVKVPQDCKVSELSSATLLMELGAKKLNGKDKDNNKENTDGDYMRGKGLHDPSLNPNSYPMTDQELWPSGVQILINGQVVDVVDLVDDPADHRGVLSWYSQKQDRTLHEAGSYGQKVTVNIPVDVLKKSTKTGTIHICLKVDAAFPGGLAIYGEKFGRYPFDPTLILK